MENFKYFKTVTTSLGQDIPQMYESVFLNDSDNRSSDNLIVSDIEAHTLKVMLNTVQNFSVFENSSDNFIDINNNDSSLRLGTRDPLSVILPITICYLFIFIAGVLGNVVTCIVIAKNKTMHTATNYYLFNLAVSDFLVLMFGEYDGIVVSN